MIQRTLTIIGFLSTLVCCASAQRITWIRTDQPYTLAQAISPDGAVVVGYGTDLRSAKPFRWTDALGVDYFYTSTIPSRAYDVSQNGVIVGIVSPYPFLWHGGSAQFLCNCEGIAYSVSADGSVVAGWYKNQSGEQRAFRWTALGGLQDIGTLGGVTARAYGVSDDGQVVVGEAYDADPCCPTYLAFRWDPVNGMQSLGFSVESAAFAASADGSVIVGKAGPPFRWESGTVTYLSSLRGVAVAVSDDGATVVGYVHDNGQPVAFRWTSTCGFENLNQVYAHLLNGSRLEVASDISADGRYIVGWGINAATRRREGFLLETTPPNCCTTHNGDVDENGCVDDGDLLQVLFNFGSSGANLGRVDINCDETVDDADLLIVLFNFGTGC